MTAIIIKTEEKKGLKLLTDLAKQLGYSVSIVSDSEIEDFAFGKHMDKIRTGETVSREELMEKLNS